MTIPRRLAPPLARVVVVLLSLIGAAAPVRAQRSDRSQAAAPSSSASVAPRRFWGALSLGNATASLACSVCRDISDRSVAAGLTLGVRQTPRTYFAVQLDGWYHFKAGENDRVYSIGPMVQYYPVAKRPLFVRLGMSWATYLATDEDENLSSRSVAAQLGVGYDFIVSRSYLLTPFASYMRGGGGRLSLNGEQASIPAGVEMLQYGLQITLR
ncbi:MAG TPA: hypothetical protein VH762_17150 [Gemmatimonadaceae bacterium]